MRPQIHPVALILFLLVAGCGTPAAPPPSTPPAAVPTPASSPEMPAGPSGPFRIEVRERFPGPDVDLIQVLGLMPNESVEVTLSIPGQEDVAQPVSADATGTISFAHPRERLPVTVVARRASGEVAEIAHGEAPDPSASDPSASSPGEWQPSDLSVGLEDVADPAKVLVVVGDLPTGETLKIQVLMPRLALLFEGERADASGGFSIIVPRSGPGDAVLVVITRESGEIASAAIGSPGPRAPFGVRFEPGAAGSADGALVVEGLQPGTRVSLYWEFRENDKEGITKVGACSDFFGEAWYESESPPFPPPPFSFRAIGPDGETASGSHGSGAIPLPDDLPPLTPENLLSGC